MENPMIGVGIMVWNGKLRTLIFKFSFTTLLLLI